MSGSTEKKLSGVGKSLDYIGKYDYFYSIFSAFHRILVFLIRSCRFALFLLEIAILVGNTRKSLLN